MTSFGLHDWLDWLSDWLHNWLSDWLHDWLTAWLTDCMTNWLSDWLHDWLTRPWSRVLHEKVTGFQLITNCLAFYGTPKSITALTRARHPSILSLINPVHASSNFLKIHINIFLPSTPRSSKWSLFLMFPHKISVCTTPAPIRATCPAHLVLYLIIRKIAGEECRSLSCVVFALPSILSL